MKGSKSIKAFMASFLKDAESYHHRLVADGEVLPLPIVAAALGLSREALEQRLREGRMFSVRVGSEEYCPAFFLDKSLDRSQLEDVCLILRYLHDWSKWQFFSQPKASLSGITPVQALLQGSFEAVKESAGAFAER